MLNIRQRDHIRAPISLWWARAMTVRVQSRLRQEKVRKVSCNFGTVSQLMPVCEKGLAVLYREQENFFANSK